MNLGLLADPEVQLLGTAQGAAKREPGILPRHDVVFNTERALASLTTALNGLQIAMEV